ncbi:MAG: hypothetical protein AAGF47_06960 [Planctomycetota bacterium]
MAIASLGIVLLPVAAIWAFRDAPASLPGENWQPSTPTESVEATEQLDRSVFDVVLWTVPEQKTPVIVRQVPEVLDRQPPSPELTLVGIRTDIEDGEIIERAVLYDRTRDELVFAAIGDPVATGSVESIDDAGVSLVLRDWLWRMPLDGDPSWSRLMEQTP